MIALRFIADRSFVSRAIGWREEGTPSHVEYLIDDGGPLIKTFGARLSGGIIHRPYNYCHPTWEEWYTFRGIEASYAEALKFEGRKYDWKDIVALLVGRHPDYYDPQRAICSILAGYSNRMAWANGKSDLLINPNLPTWEMTPLALYVGVKDLIRKVR